MSTYSRSLIGLSALLWGVSFAGAGSVAAEPSNTVARPKLFVSTQGPFWPPSEVGDRDGNFVLLGINLTSPEPGRVSLVPNSAAIISKDTVPPLDANGKETPYNWFAAPYKTVRSLNLNAGSPDLNMVLYSLSFGPTQGDFGPAPRLPALGDSKFNLNGLPDICKDLFPTGVQATDYKRPAFPLHKVPIWGFQGDGIGYDPETHAVVDPSTATGPGCPFLGCSGEDKISFRREKPITLGDWLGAKGEVTIKLIRFDQVQGGFTHARFDFKFRRLLPDSVYTVWAIRPRNAPSEIQAQRIVQPLGIPNVIRTDRHGNVDVSFIVRHPFPDPKTDTFGRRIAGLNIVFHSDMQNWGACFTRLGAGTDAHAHLSTFDDGTFDFTKLVTVEPRR
jgi:hypothetical protein